MPCFIAFGCVKNYSMVCLFLKGKHAVQMAACCSSSAQWSRTGLDRSSLVSTSVSMLQASSPHQCVREPYQVLQNGLCPGPHFDMRTEQTTWVVYLGIRSPYGSTMPIWLRGATASNCIVSSRGRDRSKVRTRTRFSSPAQYKCYLLFASCCNNSCATCSLPFCDAT